MTQTSTDIVIIGAGLAGTAAAAVAARQGLRVTLVDRWAIYPPCFKAEKLEPDQADVLRKLDLLDPLLPGAGRIRRIMNAEGGRVLQTEEREQFGIFYHDMVNRARAALPASVNFVVGRVQNIENSSDRQRVTLVGGDEISARLVVVSSGTTGDFLTRLGIRKQMVQKEQSLAFGFTMARTDGEPFPFDALTYYPDALGERIAYLTLFLIGDAMRANLFVFWAASDPAARRFVQDPRRELTRLLPKSSRVLGDYSVVSKVDTGKIDLYRCADQVQPGIVLLADAFQNVCPTTGTGLTKVVTDVDVLCNECLPQWMATPGMGIDKIAQFYENQRKAAVDEHSLTEAWHNRQIALNGTTLWRAQRMRRHWEMRLAGLPAYFRLTRKLTA